MTETTKANSKKKITYLEWWAREGDSPVIFYRLKLAARPVQLGLITLCGSGSTPDSSIMDEHFYTDTHDDAVDNIWDPKRARHYNFFDSVYNLLFSTIVYVGCTRLVCLSNYILCALVTKAYLLARFGWENFFPYL